MSIIPAITEITPFGIFLLDQAQFLFTAPALDLLFSGDAGVWIAKGLKINKRVDVVASCEAIDEAGFVLVNSSPNVVRESDVQRS